MTEIDENVQEAVEETQEAPEVKEAPKPKKARATKAKKENPEEISDEAKKAHAEQKVKEKAIVEGILAKDEAVLEQAKAAAEPDMTPEEMASITDQEVEVEKNEGCLEDRIEQWRDFTNNMIALANKILDRTNGRTPKTLEDKIQAAAKHLNSLLMEYSDVNRADGFEVLVERIGSNANELMVIDCGPNRSTAYQLRDDIRKQRNDYNAGRGDSFVSVDSISSDQTLSSEILASTVSGIAVQLYDMRPVYKPKKELMPLDRVMRPQPALGGSGQNVRSLIR